MRLSPSLILAAIASVERSFPPLQSSLFFTPGSSYCIPNPRNGHAAAAKRAARRRRNKAKRG